MVMDVDPAEVMHLDEFAREFSISGESATFTGLLRRDYILLNDMETEMPVMVMDYREVPASVQGRTLTVGSDTWQIIAKQHTDNKNFARLILQRTS